MVVAAVKGSVGHSATYSSIQRQYGARYFFYSEHLSSLRRKKYSSEARLLQLPLCETCNKLPACSHWKKQAGTKCDVTALLITANSEQHFAAKNTSWIIGLLSANSRSSTWDDQKIIGKSRISHSSAFVFIPYRQLHPKFRTSNNEIEATNVFGLGQTVLFLQQLICV